MDEAIFVQEINTGNGLNKEIESFIFSQHSFLADYIKQVALLNVLKYKVNILFVFKAREKTDNIDMFQFLLDLNFSIQRFLHFRSLDSCFIQLLDSDLHLCRNMRSKLDRPIGAFSYDLLVKSEFLQFHIR